MANELLFWKIGLKYIGHKLTSSRLLGLRRFNSFFGVSPKICKILWDKLEDLRPPASHPRHLLWTLNFLKQYNSEHTNKALFHADEKTLRKWTWCFIELLSTLKIIKWENRLENSAQGQTCFVSLDGVDFKILEPSPFSPIWYSHKFKSAGLRYEVGICIRTGNIVWSNGGYPCGIYPDLKLAYEAYIHMIDKKELTMADKGYKNSTYFLLPNLENGNIHKRIMSRHETINKRLRQFKVLYVPFRHKIAKHKLCFDAVINITQLIIENGQPLYSVL